MKSINYIILAITGFVLLLKPKTGENVSKIEKWAEAIKSFESWSVGSKSYRNNNPGNLTYIGQAGAVDDGTGFCKFKTYADGWQALIKQLTRIAQGASAAYGKNPDLTISQIMHIYTSDPEPVPTNYAKVVAQAVGLKTTDPIRFMLEG